MGSISTLAIEPVLHLTANYDPQRDFAPLTLITEMPFVLVAGPTVPAKNLSEFIEYGRKTDKLTYASWGLGSSGHLAGELFKKANGVSMIHVPYRGAIAAITDMMGGQVSAMFGLPVDMIPQVKAGRLRAYAVTGQKRLTMLPDVPTFAESGVMDVDLRVWFGFVVPTKTPPEIRTRLQSELVAIVRSPEFTDWAESQGVVVVASSPEVLAERIRSDSALAYKLVKSISLKVED
jgi:tripartite-type tricarboxylate transporter receptor subunit TctC